MVEDKVINNIVSYLYYKYSSPYSAQFRFQKLAVLGYDIVNNVDDLRRLAEDMFKLNVDAVNQRYGDGEAEKFRNLDFHFQLERIANPMTAIRALSKWDYQCTEGDVPKTDLYQAMQEMYFLLCRDFVEDLPEFTGLKQ